MDNSILWTLVLLSLINVGLLIFLLTRSNSAYSEAGKILREELRSGREDTSKAARELREEVTGGLKSANETLSSTLASMGKLQENQLEGLTKQLKELSDSNRSSLDGVRTTFDTRVKELQEGNEKKLEEMRKTVDEKLHDTLEKRLGESFKLVSERLEAVQRGLGEMQTLATGVGDLKRALTNVKVRGTWAEVQLGALLEEILAPGQYDKNVRTKPNSNETVEYAIKLPGPRHDPNTPVWLPIDSKFPKEDYIRIQEAADNADPDALQKASEALARSIKSSAKEIHDKYIFPPYTTDFAIMFLATEGLYAEVLRQPSLVEQLQNQFRIAIAGPTTLAVILDSFRLGFQTLAIEQRAAEVWKVLAAVKTEFGKFGDVLNRVKKQLDTASRTIEKTGARTRAMARTLRSVEQIPEVDAIELLQLPPAIGDDLSDYGGDQETENGEE